MDKIMIIKGLTRQLNRYRDLYYNYSISEISDQEYDDLFDKLKKLEDETNFRMSGSPTRTVGYEIKSELKKVAHSHLMLSLNKTKSIDELKEFAGDEDCLLMCKMDGLSILLSYENGELIRAETRGNGEIGEDITHNAKVFENIPLHIDYLEHFEIEGEAIITYDDFDKINSRLPDNEKFKNPRNLVNGSVRQLDSSIAAQRHIKFIAWKVSFVDSSKVKFDDNNFMFRLLFANKLGFNVVPFCGYANDSSNSYHCEYIIDHLKKAASQSSFPIDGLVMTYHDIKYGESLGMTSHHPRHSLAFKFYDEEVTTRLNDIEWSIGKTGEFTPIAIFNEVELEGTTVSRASLHNISICKDLQLGIGDEITVYKANQIIPQIRSNLTKSNNFDIPNTCPICGGHTKITKDNDTEVLVCTNPDCRGKLLGKISHFVSKNAINVNGLSEQTLQKFIDLGWLNSFRDIYYLSEYKEEMYKLDGLGKRSVDKLLESIEKSRNTTLDRFIYGLCIPLIGRTASKTIAKRFGSGNVEEFFNAWSDYNFSQLEDFGNTMNQSMHDFYSQNYKWLFELIDEFNFQSAEKLSNTNSSIYGKTFVITGSLSNYKNRNELVSVIEKLGGKVSGSVSSKTNYLINNDVQSNSSKNKKAHNLGIPIITESDFVQMITS